jgi:hypothetical protein
VPTERPKGVKVSDHEPAEAFDENRMRVEGARTVVLDDADPACRLGKQDVNLVQRLDVIGYERQGDDEQVFDPFGA